MRPLRRAAGAESRLRHETGCAGHTMLTFCYHGRQAHMVMGVSPSEPCGAECCSDPGNRNGADLRALRLRPSWVRSRPAFRPFNALLRCGRPFIWTEPEVLLEDEEQGVRLKAVVHHQRQRDILRQGQQTTDPTTNDWPETETMRSGGLRMQTHGRARAKGRRGRL